MLTTLNDVRSIVNYLKNKPTGASISEAKAALGKQVLDPRKINAFVKWGLVSKEGDRIKLLDKGWELARKPGNEVQVIRGILDTIPAYRGTLEWIFHQQFESVTNVDVAAHMHEHHSEELGTDNENTIKDNAVCFFHLAEGAQIGKMTIGRKGSPTRLQVNRVTLGEYIEAGPSSPPWTPPPQDMIPEGGMTETPPLPAAEQPGIETPKPTTPPERLKVFIAHGKNMQVVEQVQTMLDLADIECEVAEEEETTAIPVSDKVFTAMRNCTAGIIAVTVEEGRKDSQGGYSMNDNVLIEIGAAFVLYNKRVVLLWDKRLPVPSNLQGLYRCEFEGNELSWSAGMKLMKAIQSFKK